MHVYTYLHCTCIFWEGGEWREREKKVEREREREMQYECIVKDVQTYSICVAICMQIYTSVYLVCIIPLHQPHSPLLPLSFAFHLQGDGEALVVLAGSATGIQSLNEQGIEEKGCREKVVEVQVIVLPF